MTVALRPGSGSAAKAEAARAESARLAAEQTARNLDLTRTTRFINVLELGYQSNTSNEAPTQRGWEIGFELPLFDSGDARVARAPAKTDRNVASDASYGAIVIAPA